MNDTLHTRHSHEPARQPEQRAGAGTVFMNFHFLRLDGSYHALLSNEKVVAKQEFLAAFDAAQRKLPLAAYTLTGLRSDCDVLVWRASEQLEDLQAMSLRLQSSGLGKYLVPVYSFLGSVSEPAYARIADTRGGDAPKPASFGSGRYLFVHPLICEQAMGKRADVAVEYSKLAAKHPGLRMHAADSLGIDDQDFIFAFETDQPLLYMKLAAELRESKAGPALSRETPAFTCVLRDMRDIVDALS